MGVVTEDMPIVETAVGEIRKGDIFYSPEGRLEWQARADAVVHADGEITLPVRYRDGGCGTRVWNSKRVTIPVWRD